MLYKADFFSLVVYAYSPPPLPPTAFTEPKRAQTVLNRILLSKAGFSARSCGGVGVRMLILNNFEE